MEIFIKYAAYVNKIISKIQQRYKEKNFKRVYIKNKQIIKISALNYYYKEKFQIINQYKIKVKIKLKH